MPEMHQQALLRRSGDCLQRIDPLVWEGFCLGTVPLTTQSGVVRPPGDEGQQLIDVLLLTLRQDDHHSQPFLELIEPMRLNIDEHGFLRRLHVDLYPLADPAIIDLRPRLVSRYLRRAYHWRPSTALIAAAMTQCGLHHPQFDPGSH